MSTTRDNFREAFVARGERVELQPDAPVPLIDPGAAWLVTRGHLDAIAMSVTRDRGATEFVRNHVARIPAGSLAFGFEPPRGGINVLILGFGSRDLEIHRLAADRLATLAHDHAAPLAAAVDEWALALCETLAPGMIPAGSQALKPGSSCTLAPRSSIQGQTPIVWLEHLWGSSRLLGSEAAPLLTTGPIPIPRSVWLTADEPSGFKAAAGEDLIADPAYWRGLAQLQLSVQAIADAQAKREREISRERLRAKSTTGRTLTESALIDLRSAAGADAGSRRALGPAGDALVAACRLVTERLGVVLRDAGLAAPDRSLASRVADLAAVSGCVARRVHLADRWWTRDCGPLVGFTAHEHHPVALLPHAGGMTRVDPGDTRPAPIGPGDADELSPVAFQFVRRLPDRRCTLADLVRLAPRTHAGTLARSLAAAALMGALAVTPAMVLSHVVGTPFAVRTPFEPALAAAAIAAAGLCVGLLAAGATLTASAAAGRAGHAVVAALWHRVLGLTPSPDGPGPRAAHAIAGARSAVDHAWHALADAALRLGAVAAGAAVVASSLPHAVWSIAAVVIALVLLRVATSVSLARAAGSTAERLDEAQAALYRGTEGIVALRVSAAEDRAFSQWAGAYARSARAQRREAALSLADRAVAALAPLLAVLVVVLAARDGLTAGALAAAVPALAVLATSAVALAGHAGTAAELAASLAPVRDLLRRPTEAESGRFDPGPLRGRIELANVTFRYRADEPPVLNAVSLTIEPGECVAIVGPSGCGKSTLARVILGLERPESGAVFIDGHDADGLDLHAYRRQVGVVMQDWALEPGDILSNVVGADDVLTIDDAHAALALAALDDDVDALPMGVHTIVADGLPTLSGGQRQRVLLARALASRPRVLILDEATSALDNPTQERVMAAVDRLNATRVLIAHRLSAIRHADRVVVMDNGRVVAAGSFDQLAGSCPAFQELLARQSADA